MNSGLERVLQRIKEIDSKFSERKLRKKEQDFKFFKVNTLSSFDLEKVPKIQKKENNKINQSIPDDFEEVLRTVKAKLPKVGKKLLIEDAIQQAQKQTGIDQDLLRAIIKAESNGNPKAISKAGAIGLMQIMPETARELGIKDAFDPQENVLGGAKYLKKLLKIFGNNLELALAAYNAGPGNVKKFGGVPPYQETTEYIKRVKKYFESEKSNA